MGVLCITVQYISVVKMNITEFLEAAKLGNKAVISNYIANGWDINCFEEVNTIYSVSFISSLTLGIFVF